MWAVCGPVCVCIWCVLRVCVCVWRVPRVRSVCASLAPPPACVPSGGLFVCLFIQTAASSSHAKLHVGDDDILIIGVYVDDICTLYKHSGEHSLYSRFKPNKRDFERDWECEDEGKLSDLLNVHWYLESQRLVGQTTSRAIHHLTSRSSNATSPMGTRIPSQPNSF